MRSLARYPRPLRLSTVRCESAADPGRRRVDTLADHELRLDSVQAVTAQSLRHLTTDRYGVRVNPTAHTTAPGAGHRSGPDGGTFVGVDVGGTHTDVQLCLGERLARGKALTTYDDFSRGVLEAIEVAAANLGLGRAEVLVRSRLAVNATTVVTNALTQLRGGRPGVLVTAGFRDEFRFAGCSRIAEFDDQLQVNVPDVVARRDIVEIEERIDHAGEIVVALDPAQAVEAARRLVEDHGVDSIAVCFLSSFANPANERAAAEAIRARYPDLFVTASHEVTALLGETRRWTTALLNCFVHRQAHVFLDSLDRKLREAGPAGGVVGANERASLRGEKNVLIGDMGGTSFDTGIIVDNEVSVAWAIDVG